MTPSTYSAWIGSGSTDRHRPAWTASAWSAPVFSANKSSRCAVSTLPNDIDYAALDVLTQRLTERLISAGASTSSRVALCLPRGAERIAATLAVWRQGGAILALDPAWPLQRLVQIINDADVSCVLAEDALASKLNAAGVGRVPTFADAPPLSADSDSVFDSMAYIVYTSGSTGAPKGVAISHANLGHLIDWHCKAFELSSNDRVSHIAGLGFDAAMWEIWPALHAGACLVVPHDDHVRSDPTLLQRWLLNQKISVAFVPTALAASLILLPWPAGTALRLLLTGGEALLVRPPPGLPFRLINNYGPSECTVVALSGEVSPGGGEPDLGHPITGMHVHLLDANDRAVPDGVMGEIVLSGAGVGLGYLNRPELTREYFMADAAHTGTNMYRTGDLGRRLADGRIAYLGRSDAQEQIRGVRVEPAEVAAILSSYPEVAWCTVLGEGPVNARRLVAYILPKPEQHPTACAFLEFLSSRLPSAMIPSGFVVIDHVPLTANGKFDRAKLPMAHADPPLESSSTVAMTPVEQRLATMIGALLGGQSVKPDDNFFLLGGHSLLGTQLVLQARDAFGVQLSLLDLFRLPTVATLAERITELLVKALEIMSDEEALEWMAD